VHHEAPEVQRAGHVAERTQHDERAEHRDTERDADDARNDPDTEDRREDPEEEPKEEGRPDAPSGEDNRVGGTREQPHEQEPEHGCRQGHCHPQHRQDDDDEPGEEAVDVELLYVTTDGSGGGGRGRARSHVAQDVRARPYGRLPVQHGDAAVDAPVDDRIAVEHQRVPGHAAVDQQVASSDVHGAVHAAIDASVSVGRHRRSVDGLALRDDETAGHADAPVTLRLASGVLRAGGMCNRQ
jgi:hypothetical protein